MNIQDLVRQLLEEDEGPTLDFKSSSYKFTNDHYKAQFIKDIVSMANTPREGSSYILTGISRYPNGEKEIKGISEHPDDASLQQLLTGKVRPIPTFNYRAITYQGISLGLIEIIAKKTGPYIPIWNFQEVLKKDVIYFRRGSSNDIARAEDIKEVVAWMDRSEVADGFQQDTRIPSESGWDTFFEACNRFGSGYLYVLVMNGKEISTLKGVDALSRVNWSMVIDFDPDTDTSGVLSKLEPDLKKSRGIHLLTLKDRIPFNLTRGTYWIAAAGLKNRPSSLCGVDWRSWYKKHSADLYSITKEFIRAGDESPVIFISLLDDHEFVRTVSDAFLSLGGESIKFVFASSRNPGIQALASTYMADAVDISIQDVCSGLSQYLPRPVSENQIFLPGWEGDEIAVPIEDLPWLEEELEFVNVPKVLLEDRQDFLKGKRISWSGLEQNFDIERDKTEVLQRKILRDLQDRSIKINYLYHWPGAGGTTIARRIGFLLHKKYPVICLFRFNSDETISRLRYIYDLTHSPILVLIEGSDISKTMVNDLHNEALRQQLPLVICMVLRTFDVISEKDAIFVPSTLTLDEARSFAASYGEAKPEIHEQLVSLALSQDTLRRNPFYFGLLTFEERLVSLDDFVTRRIDQATEIQEQILTFLALAYKYGQKSISAQIFCKLLGIRQNRIVQFNSVFPNSIQELIIQDTISNWRPSHHLIAQELLEQILAGSADDKRVWSQNLSVWACKFIELVAGVDKTVSDQLLDVINRMFIYREFGDVAGQESTGDSRYTPIMNDITSPAGRITVFQKLVDLFPTEPHYWGHLGRLYASDSKQYDKALTNINIAISLDDQNNVFFHMKGMVLRQQVYELMQTCQQNKTCSIDELASIKSLVEEASLQFASARSFARVQEAHAHVSDIQLLIRTIDFGFRMSGLARAEFLISPQFTWYRELLNNAEDLLIELKRNSEGWEPDQYILSCESNIQIAYGNFSRVLEGLRNILERTDIYQPPVRKQLVYVYLRRHSGSWDDLAQKELEQISSLMVENLEDNPTDDKSISLWFQAVRRIHNFDAERAIERLTYWNANTKSVEAKLYLYILHVLIVMDGSIANRTIAKDLIIECSKTAQPLGNRHYSIEWYGKGEGMMRLKNHRLLGKWEEEFENQSNLKLVDGQISSIIGPGHGFIEMNCGLQVFFVPNRGYSHPYAKGRDENKKVKFFLAFSYDGLRAWSVRDA